MCNSEQATATPLSESKTALYKYSRFSVFVSFHFVLTLCIPAYVPLCMCAALGDGVLKYVAGVTTTTESPEALSCQGAPLSDDL